MKVVHVTTSCEGGAGRAASRLVNALAETGTDAVLAVALGASSNNPAIRIPGARLFRFVAHADRLSLQRYPKRNIYAWWSNNSFPTKLATGISKLRPDLVHLHWIGDGAIRPQNIHEVGCPIVWTLHDMWAFTGGCHYSNDCRRFESECGSCPQLGSHQMHDLSRKNLVRKTQAYDNLSLTVITPSQWLAGEARRSGAMRNHAVETIPNCVPIDRFRPRDRTIARTQLGLNQTDCVVLAGAVGGATDSRKGFDLLKEAMGSLAMERPKTRFTLAIFGEEKHTERVAANLDIQFLGTINDDVRLSWVYSASDVMAVPSRQDNLPNVMLEALACGIPVVGFRSGGLPEVIGEAFAGRVADTFSGEALAAALLECMDDDSIGPSGQERRVQFAHELFSPSIVAEKHRDLYELALTAGSSGKGI